MKLLRDIAEMAVDGERALSDLLRKCLILNASLKDENLQKWLLLELNGYDDVEDLPEYRLLPAQAKGHFVGRAGSEIKHATLAPALMPDELSFWATTARLMQPIASYDAVVRSKTMDSLRMPWPQDLVLLVGDGFYQGYNLMQAWQVLGVSGIISLCDTVRNRVIQFALQIDSSLAGYGEDVSALPKEEVARTVTNIIYGNNNVISGHARDIINNASSSVRKNDIDGLYRVLELVGAREEDADELRSAMAADKADEPNGRIGSRTSSWLSNMLVRASNGGLKVGVDVAAAALTEGIKSYLGL